MLANTEKDTLLVTGRKNTYPQLETHSGCSVSAGRVRTKGHHWLGNWSVAFLSILLHIFSFYALITENTSNVSKECGYALWIWILARFIIAVLESLFIAALSYGQKEGDEVDFRHNHRIKQGLCLVFLHIVYFGVECIVVFNAMEKTSCTTALSSASFLNAPLLGVIGYIYLFLDSLVIIFSVCAYCRIFYGS